MKRLKIGIALITTLSLLFGTVGIATAKTTTPVHKSATHVTQHAKTKYKSASFSKQNQKVSIIQTAKKTSITNHTAVKKAIPKVSVVKTTTAKPTTKHTTKQSSTKTTHHFRIGKLELPF